ncbi:MAG: hypothetical protein JNK74_12530 [Candidatus Hydrogenedentes bacterium]|nr:hypothetical protein [Candidatus Hydrogenedentota bacterium]
MVDENFGFAGGDDDQTDPKKGQGWSQPDDRNTVDTEALERWLVKNRNLWFLGLRLAAAARQYKREYRNIPFNQNGWFSPN